MKMSHVHCRVRDLQGAAHWFEKVWQIAPVFNNEKMVWLSFGELGVILDAAPDDSIVTIGFDSSDCDAFVWPTRGRDSSPQVGSRQGYQWVDWRRGRIEFCAVSD
jgi:hypothetical protein